MAQIQMLITKKKVKKNVNISLKTRRSSQISFAQFVKASAFC